MLILVAIGTFLVTNIDDFILLMVFFAQDTKDKIKRHHIWIGQVLALGLITGLAFLGSFLIDLLPQGIDRHMNWLGLLPLGIGLFYFVQNFLTDKKQGREKHEDRIDSHLENRQKLSIPHLFFLLFSTGADNVGVYIPIFVKMEPATKIISLGIFFIITLVICLLASLLASDERVSRGIAKTQLFLVPAILILIGLAMLLG